MDEATTLHLIASLLAQAERFLPLAVAEARDGMQLSWEEIAALLAMSEDAVQARFDPASPTYDGRWPYDMD